MVRETLNMAPGTPHLVPVAPNMAPYVSVLDPIIAKFTLFRIVEPYYESKGENWIDSYKEILQMVSVYFKNTVF